MRLPAPVYSWICTVWRISAIWRRTNIKTFGHRRNDTGAFIVSAMLHGTNSRSANNLKSSSTLRVSSRPRASHRSKVTPESVKFAHRPGFVNSWSLG